VQLESYSAGKVAGTAKLAVGPGWTATPESQPFSLEREGQETTVSFQVTPPSKPSASQAIASVNVDKQDLSFGVLTLDYPHIPQQTVFPIALTTTVHADIKVLAKHVGYVMGAGDEIPGALRQLGCQVTLLSEDELSHGDLSRFDTIVSGVRAYNTRADLRANHHRLMDYVERGGTYVVQYNVLERGEPLSALGPFPLKIGRDRVSVEEAPVEVLKADHALLSVPNKITAVDFKSWIQERGLYFASEWDSRYEAVIASNDPGEKPLAGGLLYAPHGKGVYVFTSYSWFRQLPAGVPGAYRIFANLLSAGRTK
jgi:hypothetical protein